MTASAAILLALALLGALLTLTALVRVRRLGWVNAAWFLGGWLTSELAAFHLAASVIVLAIFAAFTAALAQPAGTLAALLMAASWIGLLAAMWRARAAPEALEDALRSGLGAAYRDQIPPARLDRIPAHIDRKALLRPFALRQPGVEWLRDIRYGDEHPRQVLDVYRPAGDCRNAPVLMQVHGGAWVIGDKRQQALPLIYFLVARGWIVVANNYRLSPQSRFPAHLLDCKRALAWTRSRIADYGGDPDFIAVTGGSAGGHLATLLGLTANDERLQAGFERVDTSVAACVPFYGVYDFLDRHQLKGGGRLVIDWLSRTVMPGPPAACPDLWDRASPLTLLRADAPPFFVLHGTHDSLAPVEEARLFVNQLRAVARKPVLYAELPGTQHAWEIFKSSRALHTTHAVARFLEWCRANR